MLSFTTASLTWLKSFEFPDLIKKPHLVFPCFTAFPVSYDQLPGLCVKIFQCCPAYLARSRALAPHPAKYGKKKKK